MTKMNPTTHYELPFAVQLFLRPCDGGKRTMIIGVCLDDLCSAVPLSEMQQVAGDALE